ncbi:LysR family transcriptional regulator [Bizionia gelidisalsuginis]|uniref:LysR family transcriptional regulator n=1 Tax=Bizionia gelidisalsuginis TaxID=291188 RepID=A0ABY3MAZ8_9FLAO|nr:LysR family transcriptional regulator [Bizionia gelidisalsuginis]TYC13466.1 LysR family transcriptional regulator [Bizionia gelidisalsuginis]
MRTKLHVFKTVAYHLSFTKAAEQLYISQPAVSKAVRNLEDDYKTTFFLRHRNSIELTDNGKVFLEYVNKILNIFSEIDNQFLNEKEALPKDITFGVSSTLATYIIPKIIANFRVHYPETRFKIKSGNSEDIEVLLLNQHLDFGITEGKESHKKLQFKPFLKDEIVLVTNANNTAFKNGVITLEILQQLPIIEREFGSGTRNIIYEFLNKKGITALNTVVTLNSTEAIKNYLYNSDNYALISINAVSEDLKNNKLRIIDISDLTMERWFHFVCRTGYQSKVMDSVEKFIRNNYS